MQNITKINEILLLGLYIYLSMLMYVIKLIEFIFNFFLVYTSCKPFLSSEKTLSQIFTTSFL